MTSTPILVGVGIASQREKDPRRSSEAVQLMAQAARAALADSGAARIVDHIGEISVPKGLWGYANPAQIIAEACRAREAKTVLSELGVLQQTLFARACEQIAAGEIRAALVVGGEAKYRSQQAAIAGVELSETRCAKEPDETLRPDAEIMHAHEIESGLLMPTHYYAIIENALRAARGLSIDESTSQIDSLWAEFSRIAAENPHAWERAQRDAEQIRSPQDGNRMLAWPYAKAHNSQWNVDQAAALLLCSQELADQLGVARERRVWPLAMAESNHMLALVEREQMHRCPAAGVTGKKALELANCGLGDIDLIDLYSCFPVAVRAQALELGLDPLGSRPLTLTGGMRFAGGPLNNYVLQATAQAAQRLRMAQETPTRALITCVSGILTKQGSAVWSSAPPAENFRSADVSAAVAKLTPRMEVTTSLSGRAKIAGYTTLFESGQAQSAIAICDVAPPDSHENQPALRTIARCEDPRVADALTREEGCGKTVAIELIDGKQSFTLAP